VTGVAGAGPAVGGGLVTAVAGSSDLFPPQHPAEMIVNISVVYLVYDVSVFEIGCYFQVKIIFQVFEIGC
jgi:hypothetical protein